jgi:predicted ArsR family transcriptional regulator
MVEQLADGGRKPRATDREILAVFADTDDPVLSTAEVAQELPIKRRGVLNRLRRLEAEGELASKKIGGRNTVWWLTDGRDTDALAPAETPPATHGVRSVGGTSDAVTDDTGALPADVDQAIETWEPSGSAEKQRQRRDALRACLVYLRDRGTATRSDFTRDVYPDHTAGYTDGKDPGYSWWNNSLIDGLNHVAEHTDALEKADHSGEWRYVGTDA